MFKTKSYLLVAIMALSLGFISCSDDDDDVKYPKTLNYKRTEVVGFRLYVGSENGGKEVSTVGLNPTKYWSLGWLAEDQDWAKGFSIEFIDDDNLTVNNEFDSENFSTKYKFEGGKLFFFGKEENEWDSFIRGNRNELIIEHGYIKYQKITTDGLNPAGSSSDDTHASLEDMIGENKMFNSLSEMKHIEDTVMWYNINYIYE
ncbi:MAG: hypothetical protein ACK5KL_00020 [Dysgonomonas sp.]|jgi:hypothetical protein|nr:hypothetical protein [Prevotella sp.]